MDFSRRAMLGAMGGLAVGGSIAAMSGNVIAAPAAPEMTCGKDGLFDQQYGLFGWKAHKIDDIAAANGFHSTTYFRKVFRSMTDLTPTDYRKALQKERE